VLGYSAQTIAALVAVAVALLVVAAVSIRSLRGRERGPDIPPAMAPGPSDEALERPLLLKLQAWGMLLFLFLAIWLPVYWLREPGQNVTDELAQTREAVERGKLTTEQFEEGVNPFGFDCERCHGPGLRGGINFFQGNFVPVPDLTVACDHLTLDEVRDTVMQGRAGTDMPSWSIRFAGPMDDQQINEIVLYLLSIQQAEGEENLCLNPPEGQT
jgi:mono/diheme cytochrome c family protein